MEHIKQENLRMLRMFEGKQFQVRGPKLHTESEYTIVCYHDGVTKYRIAE